MGNRTTATVTVKHPRPVLRGVALARCGLARNHRRWQASQYRRLAPDLQAFSERSECRATTPQREHLNVAVGGRLGRKNNPTIAITTSTDRIAAIAVAVGDMSAYA